MAQVSLNIWLSGLVIACYITKVPLSHEVAVELTRYLANEQRRGLTSRDQGWGLCVHLSQI